MNNPETSIGRLQQLLRELLQLDLADLDFGFYRLIRLQRDEIEAFIQEQLPAAVGEAFAAVGEAERADLEDRVEDLAERLRADVADDVLGPDGGVTEEYRGTKVKAAQELIGQYDELRQRLDKVRTSEAQRIEVFNHLYAFFARYYEDGDFIAKRRYGRREQYAVPYDGEETLLHWANQGQHYVKSAEVLRDYAFAVEGDLVSDPFRVRFTLTRASVPPGDTKGDARYFFAHPDDVEWDEDSRTLRVPFVYRRLTEDESHRFGRTGVQQAILDGSLESLRAAMPDGVLRGALLPDPDTEEESPGDEEPAVPLLLVHLRRFVRRQTSDYFVHRDLKGFLERELEFYIKDQVLHLADLEADLDAKRRMLRVLREVSGQVITFLAQLEEVQKRLFEKRKFVLRTDYLVLIDAVPKEMWKEVLANQEQVAEWERLFRIDPAEDLLNPDGETNEAFLESHPTLVVNTALFTGDFSDRLLASFDDIEEATGGILVHSENYQALRLLEPRFRDEVKCIYIDPPYNTGSDDFLYKDRYQHSSWLTMMEGRLRIARSLLSEEGAIFISSDDREQPNLRRLADCLFGASNFIDTVIWQKVFAPKNTARHFSASHDFITVYARVSSAWRPNLLPRTKEADDRYSNPDDDPRGPWTSSDLAGRNYYSEGRYTVRSPGGKEFSAPPGRYWTVSKARFDELEADGRIWWGADDCNVPRLKRFLSDVQDGIVPQTIWPYNEVGHTQEAKRELLAVLDFPRNEDVLQTVKPTRLIRQIVHLASHDGDWVMDFFAGSGTTGHAVLDRNRESEDGPRRFVLVEQGEYFDALVWRRIARALFAGRWGDQKPAVDRGEGALPLPLTKVLRLESYEDALHNLSTAEAQERQADRGDAIRKARGGDEYRLRYLARLPLEASSTLLDVEQLAHPFSYELEVLTDDGPERRRVDLVETFNLVYGLRVRRIDRWVNEKDDDRLYRVVIGSDEEGRSTLVIWRDMTDLDAGVERDFVSERIDALEGAPFDTVLINGDSAVKGARSLDPVFKARMEEEER